MRRPSQSQMLIRKHRQPNLRLWKPRQRPIRPGLPSPSRSRSPRPRPLQRVVQPNRKTQLMSMKMAMMSMRRLCLWPLRRVLPRRHRCSRSHRRRWGTMWRNLPRRPTPSLAPWAAASAGTKVAPPAWNLKMMMAECRLTMRKSRWQEMFELGFVRIWLTCGNQSQRAHYTNWPNQTLASDDWEKKLGRACQILSNLSDFSTLAGNFQIFKIFHSHWRLVSGSRNPIHASCSHLWCQPC